MTPTESETTRVDLGALQAKRLRAFSELGLGLALRQRAELTVETEAPLFEAEPLVVEPESLISAQLPAPLPTHLPAQLPAHLSSSLPLQSLKVTFPIRHAEARPALSLNIGTLEALQQQVAECVACGLCKGRTQTVFAAGNPLSSLAIVGEAPGAEEDRTGQAFVGPAGKLLDGMLASVGLTRAQDAYLCNVLKCIRRIIVTLRPKRLQSANPSFKIN